VKGLFPEPGTMSKKDEEKTVTMGRLGSFHVPIEEDQLLTEQGIFDNKVRATAGHVR